ncbi:MAG: UDP-2,3-diacylglucosamine diphosphatase [Bacteroidales bacterium]|nr:UDP-2,3-diacylglucosamine diphosphatase [Bacteroidales bacterium]
MARTLVYFVSDVHLGLSLHDPQEREARFLHFLRTLPVERTKALYLLGDIWDFWYEYRDVVPREGARVVAALTALVDAGVEVYFFEGNHDMWCYSFFESLGIRKLSQPAFVTEGGKTFCLGHGDGLGGGSFSFRLLQAVFHSRLCRALFSTLHPTLAFRLAQCWSRSKRETHGNYRFRGTEEPLYRFAARLAGERRVDYFLFGHYHDAVGAQMPSGAQFRLLPDWMHGGEPYACFDTATSSFALNYAERCF